MVKIFRLPLILLVISVLALSSVACAKPWESVITLTMTVNTPQDGATVTTSPVTVSGTLSKSATVKVNGIQAAKGDKFSSNAVLSEGANVITIVATVGEETVTRTVNVTYAPTK